MIDDPRPDSPYWQLTSPPDQPVMVPMKPMVLVVVAEDLPALLAQVEHFKDFVGQIK